jgi:hypothetical protein
VETKELPKVAVEEDHEVDEWKEKQGWCFAHSRRDLTVKLIHMLMP